MTDKPLRILLVHDGQGTCADTRTLLLQTDLVQIELHCALSRFATKSFHRNYYHVCVIDSADTGLQLLEASLRVGFKAPIVMITADSATEVLGAMRLGAADCLIRDTLTAQKLEESICVAIESARLNEHEADCARLYLSLVDHSNEIMYTHDLHGDAIFINRAGEQVIKYSIEEIAKLNFRQIVSAESVTDVWRTIERLLAERKPSTCKAVLLSKEGQRIPVDVTMHLVYKEGNPVGVQGVARDLSWSTGNLPLVESKPMVSFVL